MVTRARAQYEITAVDRTRLAISSAERNFGRLNRTVTRVGASLGLALGGAGVLSSIQTLTAEAQTLDQTMRNLAIPLDDMQRFNIAVGQAGGSTQQFTIALQRMTRRISQAADGTGEAVDALQEMGLSAEALEQVGLVEQFDTIVESLDGLEAGDRTRLLQKIFDSEGVKIVQDTVAALDDMGEAFDEVLLTAAEQENLLRVRTAIDNIESSASLAASRGLSQLVDAFDGLAEVAPIVSNTLASLAGAIPFVGGGLRDAIQAEELDEVNRGIAETSSEMGRLLGLIQEAGEEDPFFEGLQEAKLRRFNRQLEEAKDTYDELTARRRELLAQDRDTGAGNPGGRPDTPLGFPPLPIDLTGETPAAPASNTLPQVVEDTNEAADAADRAAEAYRIASATLSELGETTPEIVEDTRDLDNAARSLGFTFRSAFEDAIIEGENLRSVMEGLLQDIARIALRLTVTQPLANAITGLFNPQAGSSSTGGVLAGSDAYYSRIGLRRPRAQGGPVSRGSPYIVGEQGPELFVPKTSGQIVPGGQMGGQSAVINFNVQAIDAQSFQSALAANQRAITGIVRQGFAQRGNRIDIG